MTPTLSPFETIVGSENGASGPNRTESPKPGPKNRPSSGQEAESEISEPEAFLATLLHMMGGEDMAPSPMPDGASSTVAQPSSHGEKRLKADEDGQPVDDAPLIAAVAGMAAEGGVAGADGTPGPSTRTVSLPTGAMAPAADIPDGVEPYEKAASVLSLPAEASAGEDEPKTAAAQAVRWPADPTGATRDERPPMLSDLEMPARQGEETARVVADLTAKPGEETARVVSDLTAKPGEETARVVSGFTARPGEETARVVSEPNGGASKSRFREKGAGPLHGRRADSDLTDPPTSEDESVDGEPDLRSMEVVENENETGIKADVTVPRSHAGTARDGHTDSAQTVAKADPLDGGGAERHTSGPHPQGEKTISSLEPAQATAPPRSVQSNLVNQIVGRAVFLQRNGQSEVRMDLKPDHLGRIQMKISTESQRVTIQMLAETPMARDIIEANLGQLRTDLASQGLDVDHLDVDMFAADDPGRQEADTLGQRRGPAGGGANGRQPGIAASSPPPRRGAATRMSDRSVDYFA